MKIRVVQLRVSQNIEENISKILKEINSSETNEWVIFPEGMLSGYYPEDDKYVNKLDWNKIEKSIDEVQNAVKQKGIKCISGTAYKEDEKWFNVAIYLDPTGIRKIYKKVNLSTLDRKCFTAGDSL